MEAAVVAAMRSFVDQAVNGMTMADPGRRRAANAAGPFFVDDTCIDCDTCRWMAPETFVESGGMSAVHAQPSAADAATRAAMALLSCPTGSIGIEGEGDGLDAAGALAAARDALPVPVTDGVFHCGYHARSSFGAASYLVRRPEGNVLVDSPRYVGPLVKRLEELGGVRYLYLTHRDDVADHARFADHFGCERVLHADDVASGTRDVEIQPEGDAVLELAKDLRVIPVPGHTSGHTVLHYDDRVLFTGDHLAWSDRRGDLIAFRRACWYDWGVQTRSMERLVGLPFSWVLPGHGRRHHAPEGEMQASLRRCIEWMKRA